jgi:hypothetical protein
MSDLEFKKNFKWKMRHPYQQRNPPLAPFEIPKYDMTLVYCTLYKGVPFGPALIKFTHDEDQGLSFEGLGVFNQGVLSNGPCLCIKKSTEVKLFTLMKNGRPSDNSFATYFSKDGLHLSVYSLDDVTDVSGR